MESTTIQTIAKLRRANYLRDSAKSWGIVATCSRVLPTWVTARNSPTGRRWCTLRCFSALGTFTKARLASSHERMSLSLRRHVGGHARSEEHTSELQSHSFISYA